MYDLGLHRMNIHPPSVGPPNDIVEGGLKGGSVRFGTDGTTQFGIVSILEHFYVRIVNFEVNVIDKNDEKDWAKNRSLND